MDTNQEQEEVWNSLAVWMGRKAVQRQIELIHRAIVGARVGWRVHWSPDHCPAWVADDCRCNVEEGQ